MKSPGNFVYISKFGTMNINYNGQMMPILGNGDVRWEGKEQTEQSGLLTTVP